MKTPDEQEPAKHGDLYWTDGATKGQRIVVREADGSCWMAVSEAEKAALENAGADIVVVKGGA
jgi:hypothetical protein